MASRIQTKKRHHGEEKPESKFDFVKRRLAPYFANNQNSTAQELNGHIRVRSPWGDKSIDLFVPPNPEPQIEALNRVILPERFSAIWHIDTKDLEVIFTTYPVEVDGRSFCFKYAGRSYECSFGDSSARLLLFAEYYFAVGPPFADFRNLDSYSNYVMSKRGLKGFPKIPDAKPVSFWIKGLSDWSTDVTLDLARHLNFYMAYYDTATPQILIHSPESEATAMQPQTQFRDGAFPNSIIAHHIEDNLLHFWQATSLDDTDPIRSYINNYLILEYAAFFYIEENIRRGVRKVLMDPNAAANFDSLTARVLEAMGKEKLHDTQKMQHVLIQPWVPLIAIAAREAMIDRDVVS